MILIVVAGNMSYTDELVMTLILMSRKRVMIGSENERPFVANGNAYLIARDP